MKKDILTTNVSSLKMISRGKVRDIYAVGDNKLLMISTDRLSAFDVIMNQPIPGKGEILTKMSEFWFNRLSGLVPNHLTGEVAEAFVSKEDVPQVNGRSLIVKRLMPIPVEAVVRGYLAGSAWKEYKETLSVCNIALPPNLQNADKLTEPVFTPAMKALPGTHDENVSFNKIKDLIGTDIANRIKDVSLQIYNVAYNYAFTKGIIIADTKFEFGMDVDGTLTLMDEVLTPDSSRFWGLETYKVGKNPPSYDKQLVRDWLENVSIDGKPWNKSFPAPDLSKDVIEHTASKYKEVFHRLTK